MVRYWLRTRDPGWAYRSAGERGRGGGDRARHGDRHLDEVRRGRVAGDRRDPAPRAHVPRHQPPLPPVRPAAPGGRRARCGSPAMPKNQVLLWVEAIDVATEGALWYARHDRARQPIRALLAPGRHTDPGIRPRWWDFAQEEPKLETLPVDEGRMQALLEEVWRAAARRVRLRHRRRARAVPPRVAAFRRRPNVVPAQAAPGLRARRRRHRRARRYGPPDPGAPHAEQLVVRVLLANVHAGAHAGDHLRQLARRRRCRVRCPSRSTRGGRVVPQAVGQGGADDPTRPECRPVPRHRHPSRPTCGSSPPIRRPSSTW